jgi:hypothetical protein
MNGPPLRIELESKWCAYVRGPAAWQLCRDAQRGRKPVWSATHRAWVVTESTARNIVAAAEHGSLGVVVTGTPALRALERVNALSSSEPDDEPEGLW